jgi:crotonobetainyl-CoA:carnitine CoA-transferase CaiB-like acyl-CoA transferase
VIQSLSGVAGTIARATGEPRFVPMVMSDHTSGLIAAQCIGFALYRREKTGKGEAIDVPMLENMASFVASEHLGAVTFDPPVGPSGDGRLLSPNYRPVPTKDGYVTVRPNTNAQAFAFFDAIGRPELKTDPRFDSAASRTRHAKDYFEVQATSLGHKTTDEWVELFDKLDVPAARYNSIDDLLTDPHLEDVGFFKEEDHPSEGRIRRTKLANTFSGGARQEEGHAPLMGQHTREILAEVGYSEAEIDKMIEGEAVHASRR